MQTFGIYLSVNPVSELNSGVVNSAIACRLNDIRGYCIQIVYDETPATQITYGQSHHSQLLCMQAEEHADGCFEAAIEPNDRTGKMDVTIYGDRSTHEPTERHAIDGLAAAYAWTKNRLRELAGVKLDREPVTA